MDSLFEPNNCVKKTKILNRIGNYRCHDLNGLSKAELMDRVDTKFLLTYEQVAFVIEALEQDYSVLEVEQQRCQKYESIYYDTNDLDLYYKHHNKRLNRHKVRVRRYLSTGQSYLEIKFKNNKGRTVKKRNPIDLSNNNTRYFDDNIAEQTKHICTNKALNPTLKNQYQRVSLACESIGERITIDFDLSQHSFSSGNSICVSLSNLAVVELKQFKINRHSPCYRLFRLMKVKPVSFSKYCIGVALTKENKIDVKVNNFIPSLRLIKNSISISNKKI